MQLQSLLPDKKRLHLDHVIIDDEKCTVEVAVRSSAKEARCPKGGQESSRVHSRYRRCLADLPWQGFSVVLTWQTRRFYCRNEECVQKIFTERIPEIAAPHARRTERLSLALRCIAFSCGGEGGSRLAGRLGMVLSPDSMLRELRRMSVQPKPVPRVLGVDDWAFRKRRRYGTVLIDLERGFPVDLLPDRNADSLKQWLKEHPGVEIISRDRADCYIKGATEGAPHAIQVADRFHLVQNLREALFRLLDRHSNRVRSAIEKMQSPSETSTEPDASIDPGDQKHEPPSSSSRLRRRDLYNSVIQLHEEGISIREIARRFGIHRRTVRRFVRADGFPERAVRQYASDTDPVVEYLRQRWNEGCHNARQLTQEIQEQGFKISYHSVRRRVVKWRPKSSQVAKAIPKCSPMPSSRSLSWLLLKDEDQLTANEKSLMTSILSQCPEIERGWRVSTDFLSLLKEGIGEKLSDWIARAAQPSIPAELRRFSSGIKRDGGAVFAAITLPWSNGPVEGQVNRLKTIKRQMYGRGHFDLLRIRFLNQL